ncbi:MAG: glycosyltransferase, partial [Planctomycetia bacterium]
MTRRQLRKVAIVFCLLVCAVYMSYRLTYTLNWATPFAIFLSWFLFTAEVWGIFSMFLYLVQVWEVDEPPQQPILPNRSVDVFVPTYNEDVELLRPVVQACIAMDYEHETYLCDDGKRPFMEELAKELGAHYIIRNHNRHAKAGNLNNAFGRTFGEFLIIFDADHVPEKHFITRLLGYFGDEKLAFVQSPHAFYNFDSFQLRTNFGGRKAWDEGQLFYKVIQPGKNLSSSVVFAGAAAMFRREALRRVNWIATETITEDLHTGLRLTIDGWKSLAVSERLICGQACTDITTFHTQRLRWGEGNLSVIAYDNPATIKGLSLLQRLSYLGSILHWASGLFKLPIYVTPLVVLFTSVSPVSEFNWTLGILTVIYLITTLSTVSFVSNGWGSMFDSELFAMSNFHTSMRGLYRATFLRQFQKFVVTSKRGRQSNSIVPLIRPHCILMGVTVLALAWAGFRLLSGVTNDWVEPLVAGFWALLHFFLAAMVVRRAFTMDNRRFNYRHNINLAASYNFGHADVNHVEGYGYTADLNDMGMALVAYRPFEEGAEGVVQVMAPGETVLCRARVKSVKRLTRSPRQAGAAAGYRVGIEFLDVGKEEFDALNRVCMHYAVPRLYDYFENRPTFWQRWSRKSRDGQKRYAVRLPLILSVNRGEAPAGSSSGERAVLPSAPRFTDSRRTPDSKIVRPSDSARRPTAWGGRMGVTLGSVTEEIGKHDVVVLLDELLPVGSVVPFRLPTPTGDLRGYARVGRTVVEPIGTHEMIRTTLEWVDFSDNGREALVDLLEPGVRRRVKPALNPQYHMPPALVRRPVTVALTAMALLLPGVYGGFRLLYSDDIFLHHVLQEPNPTPAEVARIDDIYEATMKQAYPHSQRLALLMNALNHASPGNYERLDELARVLAPRDRNNLNLRMALANSYANDKNYAEADAEYDRLVEESNKRRLSSTEQRALYLAAARSAVNSGNLKSGIERFEKLVADVPDNITLRNEL